MLAGIIIPLFSLQWENNLNEPAFRNNVVHVALSAKENLIHSANAVQNNIPQGIDWLMVLQAIYLLGVLISFILLLHSAIKTFRLFRQGNKVTIDGFSVIETQQTHGPFSFFGLIFISAANYYSPDQLAMILAHENRHIKYLHSFDLLFAELCKTIFWFHPLPYICKQRLLMVHEFQADMAVQQPLVKYSSFLVAQSFVQNSPGLSHSFLHSPLKKRILMLTRKSPAMAKSKMLIAIPVLAIALVCCSKKNVVSDKNSRFVFGNKVTYKGNTFEMYTPPSDTFTIQNPETGKLDTISIQALPSPVKMNGEQLLSGNVEKTPTLKEKANNTLVYGVFVKNKELLEKLEDGEYRISVNNTVVGKNGEVLYYDWDGITNLKWDEQKKGYAPVSPQNVKKEFDNNLDQFIDQLEFNPAQKNGQPVIYVDGLLMPIRLKVVGHKATIMDDFSATAIPVGEHLNK